MGTEVLPQFLFLIRLAVAGFSGIGLLLIIVAGFEYTANKRLSDAEKETEAFTEKMTELRSHMRVGIGILIIGLLLYLLLGGVSPLFQALFFRVA